MRIVRMMLLSAALVAGGSIFAAAQYTGGVYRNGVYVGQQDNSEAYQHGWKDGQNDARHGRQSSTRVDRYHNDADRAAYDQGYAQGYQAWVNGQNGGHYGNGQVYAPNGQVYAPNGTWQNGRRRRDRDCDRDDPCYGNNGTNYPNNGGYYGNGYNHGSQVAQQNGFNDGVREGANDRATGHSYRPTSDTGYRLATNGYQGQFGSRDQYKQWYRQAYEQGYQQGYNGNGNYGGYRRPPR